MSTDTADLRSRPGAPAGEPTSARSERGEAESRPRRPPHARLTEALRFSLRSSPGALPALVAVAVLLALAADEGGYPGVAWYPAGLFLLALLAVSALVLPLRHPPPPLAVAAAGLLAAYAAWTALSIAWAENQAAAWEGANRAILYAVLFALFSLWPLRGRAAALVVGTFGLGIAVIALVALLRANAADGAGFFLKGRFAEPAGYQNANVAVWVSGFWACAVLAGRRGVPATLRGIAFAGAFVLIAVSLLGQSRGWLFTFPLGLLVLLAVVPGRRRSLAVLLGLALATYLAGDAVLAVYDAFSRGLPIGPPLAAATERVVVIAGAMAVIGTVAAVADHRLHRRFGRPDAAPPANGPLRRRRTGLALAAGICVLGLGVAVAGLDAQPPRALGDAWQEFRSGTPAEEAPAGGSRLTGSLQTNRYDMWRVALDVFAEHPVRGIGADNFQAEYLRHGRTGEQPRYPHSFELGVLQQTGVVGALLLGGALGLALAAASRAALGRRGWSSIAAGMGLSVFAGWLLYASVDWFWEFPALGGSAIAMLALAASLAPGRRPADGRGPVSDAEPTGRRRASAPALGRAGGALACLALLAPAASLTLPWLAEREVDRAIESWRAAPQAAFERLGRARHLNPVAVEPDLAGAAIAVELDRLGLAQEQLRAALARDPDSVFGLLELGAISAELGRRTRALELLRQAAAVAPQDEIIREVLDDVRRGRPVRVQRLNQELAARAQRRAR